ncbi:hypothetical protein N9104_04150 [Pseudomonadales bacterium]|nr:hypothetical protein [Pseudomonadales bacterium]
MRKLLTIITLAAMAALGGCATIMEGSDQAVNVNTTGCETQGTIICTLINKEGSSVITAPATANVEKTKGALTVQCKSKNGKATGTKVVDSNYEAMNAGNILAGGIIGIGVDAATGAMWKYPSTVIVEMSCAED